MVTAKTLSQQVFGHSKLTKMCINIRGTLTLKEKSGPDWSFFLVLSDVRRRYMYFCDLNKHDLKMTALEP